MTAKIEAAKANTPRLRMLVSAFPKGGDLHHHLAGAIDAETMLQWAGDENLCVDPVKLSVVSPPCETAANKKPAKNLERQDPALRESLIDAFSMRNYHFNAVSGDHSGHDHFFASFYHFAAALDKNFGRMLAYSRRDAAANNLFYIETMENPKIVSAFARGILQDAKGQTSPDTLWKVVKDRLPAAVAAAKVETSEAEAQARQILQCDIGHPDPACAVTMRYMIFAMRSAPPEIVFAQLALGFALAHNDPRWVGVNIVAPEDGAVSMQDYDLHMQFFRFLRRLYPDVKITLHAGELAPPLVPAAGLRDHIHKAVFDAGADRIGHGIDIGWENNSVETLQEMAKRPIPVEINLSSNDAILNVKGSQHPFALYRQYNVPVVISTDDAGVSRNDLTTEYMRAIQEQHVSYSDLKKLSRDSLEYSFLSGASLWQQKTGEAVKPVCAGIDFTSAPQGKCAEFLAKNNKAELESKLEAAFIHYEGKVREGGL
ncbi:MAG: adenosine deaminase [Zymomonas mobilis]|uniref:adenosine deaminase family protein n=1 Tax=Zymomonas mobilis TaxID=542 RepID=UPI0021AB61DD|nr:adenosine deaminase [Zymomonas mobilis]